MKTLKYITAVCFGLFLCSCDDFLDKQPETELSPNTFFASESELELWTNRFYTEFEAPDEAVLRLSDLHICRDLNDVQLGARTPETEKWSTDTWAPLRNIHIYLSHSGNCKDESVRNRYDGVAYFFRALFYFEKVRKYGDMPYYDYLIEDTDVASLKKARDSRGFVMQKVMEDLDRAIELLPDKWASTPLYRLSKDAARALKSRAALFEGTFRKYHAIADESYESAEKGAITLSADYFLKQAADAARAIIDRNKYKLYDKNTYGLNAPYREYFILEDGETGETILSRRYNKDIPVRHTTQFALTTKAHCMTRAFVDHYLMADGSRVQSLPGYEKQTYFESFRNRDPRMAQTLAGPGYKQYESSEETVEDLSGDLTGYRIIKFIGNSSHDGSTTSTTDWPLFRYAEVLLNYAEAKAESTSNALTQEDIDLTINVIRGRAGVTGKLSLSDANSAPDAFLAKYYPHVTGANKGVILEIRRERTVELACEGFRMWDMIRWKEGAQLTPASNTEGGCKGCYFPGLGEYDMNGDGTADLCLYQGEKPQTSCTALEVGKDIELTGGTSGNVLCFKGQTYRWDEARDYLWPIPVDQRIATQGALTQNPGYSDGLSF